MKEPGYGRAFLELNTVAIMSRMRGFSLIELMISVAIVAILAVLAFPAYQDYAVRSRKSEGLVLATEAKNVVTENAATSGADLGLGYVGLHTATRNVRAIQVNSLNGIVTVEFGEAAGGGGSCSLRVFQGLLL
ncbi:prepilin-type N-terminal cleavage/methylation domain-containing protein [Xanthomonas populi]